MTYTYDACQRLKEECITDKNGVQLAKYSYGLGKAGERTSVTEENGGEETEITYKYDKLNRLVKETIEKGKNSLTVEYAYDAASNRTEKTVSVKGDTSALADVELEEVQVTEGKTTYTYNALNQLIREEAPQGTTAYTYDANGNLIKQAQAGGSTADYSYDKENRLTKATVQQAGSVTVESYTYDYARNRTSKTINESSTTFYVNDTNADLTMVAAETDKAMMAIFGLAGQVDQIDKAIKSGDTVEIAVRIVQLVCMLFVLTSQCFTGDTLVSTADGLRPIEEIQAGDYVWSENTENGEIELKEVLSVSVTETKSLVHVTTENGTEINTTENHPFYVEGKGWVSASELQSGDTLHTQDGRTETVSDVETEQLEEAVRVYNLEIEDSHTYYVSADGVLVHNICGKPDSTTEIDMDEVMSGHREDGNRAIQSGKKDLFNSDLSEKQIRKKIEDAIKTAKKVAGPQFDYLQTRYRMQGRSGKQVIEMWYNVVTNVIETAYPIYGKKVKI